MRRATAPSRRVHALVLATLLLAFAHPAVGEAASVERVGGVSVAEDPTLAEAAPSVSMPAGVLRTSDGRTLWERDPDAERAMASTTKIMTALVVLDRADLTDTVTVSPLGAAVGEATADLVPGQTLTVQQLLEAMLVRSGNDAAFVLAEYVGGDIESFVALMNAKAVELGLSHTSFANPHGLDAEEHHTSAADLATLSVVAMADPRFASIASMPSVSLSTGGRTTAYGSSNKLLGTYEGATGVKTGWTSDAGYCLVASAKRGDIGFLAVVLGGKSEDDRFVQARELLDWGYTHYTMTPVATAETTAGLIPVTDYLDRTVAAVVAADAVVPVFDLDGEVVTRLDMLSEVDAPVAEGQRLGTLTVVQGSRLLAQVPVVAAADVPRPDGWDTIGIWFTRLWRTVFGGQQQAAAVPVM